MLGNPHSKPKLQKCKQPTDIGAVVHPSNDSRAYCIQSM